MSVEHPSDRVMHVEADLAEAMNSEYPEIRRRALAARVRGLILGDRLDLKDPRVHDMVTEKEFEYLTELQGDPLSLL